jgi:predicted O-linked N-acetylglucosamine transferase (SPINDLY family)
MPPNIEIEVSPLPALENGFITFGCFNRLNKITPKTVARWSQLLSCVPHSKMFLGAMPQLGSFENIISLFESNGIDQSRLILYTQSDMSSYLARHQEIDLYLDTTPSSGVTTSFYSLWMGVPVLCLEGDSVMSRGAMAVMSHLGLSDFVAKDDADFVVKGTELALQLEYLGEVRATLRGRLARSLLFQHAQHAYALETSLRVAWHRYCAK